MEHKEEKEILSDCCYSKVHDCLMYGKSHCSNCGKPFIPQPPESKEECCETKNQFMTHKKHHCEKCWFINTATPYSKDYCCDQDCKCHKKASESLEEKGEEEKIGIEAWSDEKLDKYLEENKEVKNGLTVYPTEAWTEKARRVFFDNSKEKGEMKLEDCQVCDQYICKCPVKEFTPPADSNCPHNAIESNMCKPYCRDCKEEVFDKDGNKLYFDCLSESNWEEEFKSLYEDVLDFYICCSGGVKGDVDCACNGETVKENIIIYIQNLLEKTLQQERQREREKCRNIFIKGADWSEWGMSDEDAGQKFDEDYLSSNKPSND